MQDGIGRETIILPCDCGSLDHAIKVTQDSDGLLLYFIIGCGSYFPLGQRIATAFNLLFKRNHFVDWTESIIRPNVARQLAKFLNDFADRVENE